MSPPSCPASTSALSSTAGDIKIRNAGFILTGTPGHEVKVCSRSLSNPVTVYSSPRLQISSAPTSSLTQTKRHAWRPLTMNSLSNCPISEPESRMRRLVAQVEHCQISRAPRTISPLSPLRNPIPGLDPPFWYTNQSLRPHVTQPWSRSSRYHETTRSRQPRGCAEWHKDQPLDQLCPYCPAGRRDNLCKRLLARRSQISFPSS